MRSNLLRCLVRLAGFEPATYGLEGQGTEKFKKSGNPIYINFANMTPIPRKFCENPTPKSHYLGTVFHLARCFTQ